MTQDVMDPLVEQTKNQIRKLVGEIAELAESDIQPALFHVEFLNRVVAAVAANGAALWMLDGRNNLKLQHQIEFRLTGLLDGKVRSQPHDGLLGCMLRTNQPQMIPPGANVEGVPGAGNPTNFALIIAPLLVDKQVVGLVEILMDPSRQAAAQKSTLRFVSDICDLAEGYLKNRQVRQIVSQQQLWNQLESYTHTIHGSLDLKDVSYSVANEGKRLIGCDRVSLGVKFGQRLLIEAVSGQEVVEQRANLIRELTKLCRVVVASGEDLIYTGSTDGFPDEIRDCLEAYVDESGAKAVIITLLHKPEVDLAKDKIPFACLVAEQIGDELAPTDMHARSEVVARHGATAVWNAKEHDRIFMLPVLKAMGSPWKFFKGRTLAKILAVVGLVLGVILILALVPWKLNIIGKGSLWPEHRRNTYAPVDGTVVQVLVDNGQVVKEGDLLAVIESKELNKKHAELSAQLKEALTKAKHIQSQLDERSDIRPDELPQLRSQLEEERIRAKSADEQIEVIKEQFESMKIRAPHKGIVTSWETKKSLLNRPVQVGTELVSLAETDGDWILEVDVPDSDLGPILDARDKLQAEIAAGTKPSTATLSAYFVLATNPEHRYQGTVRRIASDSELVDQKKVVKIKVGFSDAVRKELLANNQTLRPGAEVRASIYCGDARLAYVLFRDVIHVFYETVLFRWPFMK